MTVDYRKLRQLREESERNERAEEAKRKILPKSLSVLPSSIKSQEERNAEQKESHLAFVEKRKEKQGELESKQAEQFDRENRSLVGMVVSLVKSALDVIFVSYSAITEIIGTKVRSMVEETVLKGGNGASGEVLTSGDWGLYWGEVGGKITVEESDGSPSVAGVDTIQFDKDIFAITDEGDDDALVSHVTSHTGDVTVLTDFRYDSTSKQLQKKTKLLTYVKGIVTVVGEESAWTMVTGGQAEDCP